MSNAPASGVSRLLLVALPSIQIHRQLARIAELTGVEAAELNNHLIAVAFPEDYGDATAANAGRATAADAAFAVEVGAEPDPRSDLRADYKQDVVEIDAEPDRV